MNLVNNLLYLSQNEKYIPKQGPKWGQLSATLIDCYNPNRKTADYQRARHVIKKLNEIFASQNLYLIKDDEAETEFRDFIEYFLKTSQKQALFAS
ncbi:hypothetical protein IJF86_03280 [Candidatus Saccharibacteria bacterium]|nr:hypothetical protein [Candidatus Saccharibacteria bacterium]